MTFVNTDKILVNRDGVDYQAVIGPLLSDTKAVQKLTAMVKELQTEIAALKGA